MRTKTKVRNQRLREASIREQVDAAVIESPAENTTLLLEGTGPGITAHFPFLSAIGPERLPAFPEVYAFSGGIIAYLSFHALVSGQMLYPLSEYQNHLDERFLKFHHSSPGSRLKSGMQLLMGRPCFAQEALVQHFSYLFRESFLVQPISALPEQFIPFLAKDGSCFAVTPDSEERAKLTVLELLRAGCSIPRVYYRDSLTRKYSDAIYAQDFRKTFKQLFEGSRRVLASSLWRTGHRGNAVFVNALGGTSGRVRLYRDLVSTVFGVPMPHWRREVGSLRDLAGGGAHVDA